LQNLLLLLHWLHEERGTCRSSWWWRRGLLHVLHQLSWLLGPIRAMGSVTVEASLVTDRWADTPSLMMGRQLLMLHWLCSTPLLLFPLAILPLELLLLVLQCPLPTLHVCLLLVLLLVMLLVALPHAAWVLLCLLPLLLCLWLLCHLLPLLLLPLC
jgi:hypothetical protein